MSELNSIFVDGSKWGQEKVDNRIWVVYSDRNENITYMTPKGESPYSELNFGEQVCIAEIQGDFALVYTDPKASFPEIPSYAKCKGWVPMRNLLLWTTCPADERGVQMRAIIAINLNNMGQDEKFLQVKYTSPDNLTKYSNPLNMDMNFYYIMKKTPDEEFALLCTGYEFKGNNLFGWVNRRAYTDWNQRTCLEPNWYPKYVEEHKKQRIYTYADASKSEPVTWWEFGTTNKDGNPSTRYRMTPNQLRYPILSQPDDNGIIECTSFADRAGSVTKAAAFVGNISDEVNTKRKQKEQMNVILVMEASTEMSKYMQAVKSALATCGEYSKLDLAVKVGLVLYRSLDEGSSGIDIIPLSNYDDARLTSMLDGEKATAHLNSERDVALEKAIEMAINPSEMGLKKEESNMVLLIGYHGPEMNAWNSTELGKKLVANDIQMASIQVMRSDDGSCSRYFDAVSSLVKDNISAQYESIAAEAKFTPAKANGQETGDGYYFTSTRKEGSPLFASVRYNKMQGQEMTPTDVTRHVNNAINSFSKSVITSIELYDKSLADLGFYPDFLKKVLGLEGFEAWKQVKAISAYSGYAQIKDLSKDDGWRSVLYLSSIELEELIKDLEKVHQAVQEENTDRTIYVDAIRALVKSHLKDAKSDKDIDKLKPEELQKYIYATLNVKSESMGITKFSLSDISSRGAVKDEQYREVLTHFDKKYEKFRKIQQDYEYRMEVNKLYYYWIPLEDLP